MFSAELKRQSKLGFGVALSSVYGEDLDDFGAGDGVASIGGFSSSGRSRTTNLDEMESSRRTSTLTRRGVRWLTRIPKCLRLDHDFYRAFFLHIRNENFTASTMRVLLSFERLSRLIALDLPKSTAKSIVQLQDEKQMISWERFAEYIDSVEASNTANRFHEGEQGDFTLEKETALVLNNAERIFLTMDDSGSSFIASIIAFIRVGVTLLAAVGIILDSDPLLKSSPSCPSTPCLGEPVSPYFLTQIEIAVVVIFTVDYVIKLLVVGYVRMELMDRGDLMFAGTGRQPLIVHKTFGKRLAVFVMSFFSLVDLISVLPYYFRLGLRMSDASTGLQVFRVIRLVSIIRLLKLRSLREIKIIMTRAFSESLSALALLFVVFIIILLFFGTIMYFLESGTWYPIGSNLPDGATSIGGFYRASINPPSWELSPFRSVLMGIWYAIVSATTVGYGDLVPTSDLGRLIGGVLLMTGVIVLALPIAVIGSNFTAEYKRYFAINQQINMQKDRTIQLGVFKEFLEDLNEDEEALRDENNFIIDSSEKIDPALVQKLHYILDGAEDSVSIFDRIAAAQTADMKDDIREFMSTILSELDFMKPAIGFERFKRAQEVIIEISIELIQKLPQN